MASSLYLDRMEFLLIGLSIRIESELRSHCIVFGSIRRTETGHAFDEEDAHRRRALFSSALGSNVGVTFELHANFTQTSRKPHANFTQTSTYGGRGEKDGGMWNLLRI